MKRNNKTSSIKMKIFLYLIGFCAFLLVLLWFMQVVFLDAFYKRTKVNESKGFISNLEKRIDKADLFEIADELAFRNDIYIQISMATLLTQDVAKITKIYSSSNGRYKNDLTLTSSYRIGMLYTLAKENNGELIEGFMNNIVHTKIIEREEGHDLIINITSAIVPVDATVNTLRTQLSSITFVMVSVSFILALFISKSVATPIISINQDAKILATGKYDIDFNGKGYQEIEELSATLNYTAKELSKVESLRRELIANISHDLRTPLTLISGYAEAMRDLPGENNPDNAQVIIDETKRLTSLVTDVLDLSKLQTGNETLEIEQYNITNSLNHVILRFSELIKNEKYNIEFEHEAELFVLADENRISQVFYNVMINAINHTGDDKKIVIKQIDKGEFVRIEVIDTGMGIAKENLSKVWDRYYTSKEYHKRGITGTGLGLSIMKEIITAQDGNYGVESEVGKGSNFWFEIKKAPESEKAPEPEN